MRMVKRSFYNMTDDVGGFIRGQRDARALSLRDLQEMSGINNATISQIETGHTKNPGIHTIKALLKAMVIGVEWQTHWDD
jgi:transcriptional regulator with XRE-family HTH domain